MSSTMNCPGCQKPLRLRDDMAGKTIKCPRCGKVIPIPADESVILEEVSAADAITVEPPPTGARETAITTRPCPECGKPVAVSARRCRLCKTSLIDDEDDETPRTPYKPCPRCGEDGAKRVLWTAWGSFYGPALFTHVRCPGCGYAYNGKSGRSNLVPALILVAVPLLLILTILGVLFWYIRSLGHL